MNKLKTRTPKVGQTASTAAKPPDAAVEDAPPSILTGLDGVTVIRSSDGPVAGMNELLIVGKSALLRRLTQDKFRSRYDTTIGVDFGTVRVKIDGRTVKLLGWDCAGACCPRRVVQHRGDDARVRGVAQHAVRRQVALVNDLPRPHLLALAVVAAAAVAVRRPHLYRGASTCAAYRIRHDLPAIRELLVRQLLAAELVERHDVWCGEPRVVVPLVARVALAEPAAEAPRELAASHRRHHDTDDDGRDGRRLQQQRQQAAMTTGLRSGVCKRPPRRTE